MHLLVGTNNRGKFVEIRESLSGLPIDLVTPADLSIDADPHEHGRSFIENAFIKARHFHGLSRLPTIADDSGIIVDALKDELGIHTRRWGAGPQATDEEWIAYFLKRMKDEPNKRARFICTIALVDADGAEHAFEGICDGTITEALEADYLPGLPISACFRPDGFDCVYSAMKIEQKNSTSHRGRALSKLRRFLSSKLNK